MADRRRPGRPRVEHPLTGRVSSYLEQTHAEAIEAAAKAAGLTIAQWVRRALAVALVPEGTVPPDWAVRAGVSADD